jgi:tripartite-type tricarboxylate transporter receptor subunit TctC
METKMKQLVGKLVLAAVAALSTVTCVAADVYPSRPVTILVGYVPGGSPDRIARLLAKRLSEVLGQPFVIENKPGAGGTLATGVAARSTADGYTLLMGETGQLVISPYVFKSLPYDTLKDFTPVARVSSEPVLLVSGQNAPFKTLDELIRVTKANPGKYHYGSSGIGTIHHIAMESFLAAAGIKMNHIPYKGSGQSIPAILAGDVPLIVTGSATAIPHANTGKIKMLAVSTHPVPALPNVPFIGGTYKDYDFASEIGVLVRRGAPAAVVNKLAEAIDKICKEPDFAARLSEAGPSVAYLSPTQYAENLRAQLKKYEAATKVAGITPN